MADRPYQICSTCTMDTTAREIVFDFHGVCNFCHQAQNALKEINHNWIERAAQGEVVQVPEIPKPDPYLKTEFDCLVGLSGGVDSSFLLHKAKQMGFRPLAFSVDTGYNKPEADENIMKLVEGLKVPFIRYTIDLDAFKSLQAAFLRSGVKNVEIPTDHILMAVSLKLAAQYKIKTILSGGNVNTESIMPPSWGWNARDLTHIKAISKRFGGHLKNLPTCSLWYWNWHRWVLGTKTVYLLDYFNYNRAEAEKFLCETYDYVSTGEKHEENYFTWWFQNFYLFEKWGIDKRKAHYSSMINSGQMTREEAMFKLTANPVYPELGFEKKVLFYPKHEHSDFPQDKWYGRISHLVKYYESFE